MSVNTALKRLSSKDFEIIYSIFKEINLNIGVHNLLEDEEEIKRFNKIYDNIKQFKMKQFLNKDNKFHMSEQVDPEDAEFLLEEEENS